MLLQATTEATAHMGGSGGVAEALALLLAGVAQGCPVSAMVCCVVVEMPALLALLRVPPCWGLGGPFKRLGYMDDTTWCIDSESDLPLFADNLQRVGLHSNVFSSGPKRLLVNASCEGFQVDFHSLSVYMAGLRMPVHQDESRDAEVEGTERQAGHSLQVRGRPTPCPALLGDGCRAPV